MFLSVKSVGLTVLTGILSDLHQKIQDGVCLFGVSLFARLRNSLLSHNYSIVPLLVVNVVGAETNRTALIQGFCTSPADHGDDHLLPPKSSFFSDYRDRVLP